MGLTREEKARQIALRRSRIVGLIREPGGKTGNQLAAMFGTSRGTILKDIAELRKKGYPIQVSSRREENGLMVAVYEIPRYLMK